MKSLSISSPWAQSALCVARLVAATSAVVFCAAAATAAVPSISFWSCEGQDAHTCFDVLDTNQWYAACHRVGFHVWLDNAVSEPPVQVDDLVVSCTVPPSFAVERVEFGDPVFAQWNGVSTSLVLRAAMPLTSQNDWSSDIDLASSNSWVKPKIQVQRFASPTRVGGGQSVTQSLVVAVFVPSNALSAYATLSLQVNAWDIEESGITVETVANTWSSADFFAVDGVFPPDFVCLAPARLAGEYTFTNVLLLTNTRESDMVFVPGVQVQYSGEQTSWSAARGGTGCAHVYSNGIAVRISAPGTAVWQDQREQCRTRWTMSPKWAEPLHDAPGCDSLMFFRGTGVGQDGRPFFELMFNGSGSNLVAGTISTPDSQTYPLETEPGKACYFELYTCSAGDIARFTNGTYQVRLYDMTNALRQTYNMSLSGSAVLQRPALLSPSGLCLADTTPSLAWAGPTNSEVNSGFFILDNNRLDNEVFLLWQGGSTTNCDVSQELFAGCGYQLYFASASEAADNGADVMTGYLSGLNGIFNVVTNAESDLAFARIVTTKPRLFIGEELGVSLFDFGFLPGTNCTFVTEFGDGYVAGGLSATHQYAAGGEYAARVVVTDNTGVSATGAVAALVYDLPRLTRIWSTNGVAVAMGFPTVDGGLYRVAYKDDLRASGWDETLSLLMGDGLDHIEKDDLRAGVTQRFYRLECELNPSVSLPPEPFVTPYVDEADMQGVNEAFSATADCPWGFIHTGIDFFPTGDDKAFQAVCDGTVESAELWQNGALWQVNVRLQCDFDPRFRIEYSFEPMSADEGDGLTQLSRITVGPGDHAARGDVIGRLLESGDGAHVDFGLIVNWERVSPEPCFSREARDSILRLIRAVWGTDAKMTY